MRKQELCLYQQEVEVPFNWTLLFVQNQLINRHTPPKFKHVVKAARDKQLTIQILNSRNIKRQATRTNYGRPTTNAEWAEEAAQR
jgi:hypothetical protein